MPNQTWTDAKRREWRCGLDLGAARELRNTLNVDLLGEAATARVAGLLVDHDAFGNVLWFLTEKQCGARQVTRGDFDSSLDGEALHSAWAALHDAYLAFCPPASRVAAEAAIARQVEAMEHAGREAAAMMNGPEAAGAIRRAIDETLTEIRASLSTIGSSS